MSTLTAWWENLTRRVGEHAILLALLPSQLIANLGLLPGLYFVQINAEIDPLRFRQAVSFLLFTLVIGYGILIATVLFLTRHARARLRVFAERGEPGGASSEEARAWEEITSIEWKYALAAGTVMLFVDTLPLLVYENLVLRLSYEQIVYTLIGALIVAGGGLVLNTALFELFLTPVRKVLTPHSFETQIASFRGLSLQMRFLVLSLTVTLVSVALVAPIGYRQTYRVLFEAVSSIQVLQELQARSLGVAVAALLLGLGLAFVVSRSLNLSLQGLLDTVEKVEAGNWSERAPVAGADDVGKFAIYFNRMLERLEYLQKNPEQEVTRRTTQWRATLQVAQAVSSILVPDQLMEQVVRLISEQFGYYYVAIFLIDESGEWAELKHATGEAGRLLRQQGHRLPVAGKSMVGAAIRLRQARIALDVGAEAVRFDTPLLPYTRSEVALPLMVGGEVLGALDAQSTQEAAFSEADIETLQAMANQVAIALQNARLFGEMHQSLQELRALQRQYVRQGWSDLLRAGEIRWEAGEASTQAPSVVRIPLPLRGEAVGEISLQGDLEWGDEEKEWLETLASQAALALESARLLEESARRAELERIATQIVQRTRSTLETQTILRTAARELQRLLRLPEVVLHFGPPPQRQK